MAPVIEMVGVTKRFGGVVAVDGFDLRVHVGEIVAVIGPNGAGKTTLLNCLTGEVPVDAGDVFIDGRPAMRLGPHRRARLGVARTFQQSRLFGSMTALENLTVAAECRVRRGPPIERDRPILEAWAALEFLGLLDDAGTNASAVPLGTRRRVEIGRALCLRPRVLVLDEPAAGLSGTETTELAALLERIRDTLGVAIVVVEHDLDLVLGVSDHVYVMNFGKLLSEGTPTEIKDDPAVVTAYFGKAFAGA